MRVQNTPQSSISNKLVVAENTVNKLEIEDWRVSHVQQLNDKDKAVMSCVSEILLYVENGKKNTDWIAAKKNPFPCLLSLLQMIHW